MILSKRQQKALLKLIEYNWDSENNHYLEENKKDRKNHIFNELKILNRMFDKSKQMEEEKE